MGKPPARLRAASLGSRPNIVRRQRVTLPGGRTTLSAMARDPAPHLHRPGHLLPGRRFPHRPVAAGCPRADHAWPFRPCPARASPLSVHRQAAPRDPPPPRPDRARHHRLWRTAQHRRASPSPSIRRAMSPAPPRSGWSGRARSGSSRATTRPTADGLSEPFEPVPCDTFITECTFGLPVFRWQPQPQVMEQINRWWAANAAEGRVSILGAYALGKAQRIMAALDPSIGPILTHGAVEATTAILREQGYRLPAHHPRHRRGHGQNPPRRDRHRPALGRGDALGQPLRPDRRRRLRLGLDARCAACAAGAGPSAGFVLSDHADWPGLNERDPRHRAPPASSSPMATPPSSAAGWRRRATTPASSRPNGRANPRRARGRRGRRMSLAPSPFFCSQVSSGGAGGRQPPVDGGHEALRPPLRRPRRHHQDLVPRPRRWPPISARRPRKTGSGPSPFCPAAARSGRSTPPNCGNGRPRPQACRSGCSKRPMPSWAIWPRRSR